MFRRSLTLWLSMLIASLLVVLSGVAYGAALAPTDRPPAPAKLDTPPHTHTPTPTATPTSTTVSTPTPTASPTSTVTPPPATGEAGEMGVELESPGATATPLAATPTPTAEASSTPTVPPPTAVAMPLLGGEPAPVMRGTLVMRTYSLDFYQLPGGLSAESIRQIALDVEHAIAKDSVNMKGEWLSGRVAIRFEPAQQGICAIRGLTLSNKRMIRMFYEPDANPQYVLAILAHELFHQLQHDYYGEPDHRRSDTILLEGMATWGSSAYFLDAAGVPTYRTHVRDALREETLLPLTTDLEVDCRTSTRGNIYSQWASFVEYLLLTYGRDKLDAVYIDSTGRPPGSANYRGVYGKSLHELETDWINWLKQTNP